MPAPAPCVEAYFRDRKKLNVSFLCILRRRADTGAFMGGHSAAPTDRA